MADLLCEFATRFPDLAANILHRDRHKRRNFREETITDLLMAGLIGYEPFGIYVDFPADESKTGEDMDWEFVDPDEPNGRCYLRLHIQAKRAIRSTAKTKSNRYWYYRELDHAVPKGAKKGSQHEMLLRQAHALPGCVPLYAFYHPKQALNRRGSAGPAIEGVNLMFADQIPVNLTAKAWPRTDKKVATWRPHFLPLSTFLCFGTGPKVLGRMADRTVVFYLAPGAGAAPTPGAIADRLNELRGGGTAARDERPVATSQEIPQRTRAALEERRARGRGARTERPAIELERPRVIFDAQRIRSDFLNED